MKFYEIIKNAPESAFTVSDDSEVEIQIDLDDKCFVASIPLDLVEWYYFEAEPEKVSDHVKEYKEWKNCPYILRVICLDNVSEVKEVAQ